MEGAGRGGWVWRVPTRLSGETPNRRARAQVGQRPIAQEIMARLDGESSNALFETLEEWNTHLKLIEGEDGLRLLAGDQVKPGVEP